MKASISIFETKDRANAGGKDGSSFCVYGRYDCPLCFPQIEDEQRALLVRRAAAQRGGSRGSGRAFLSPVRQAGARQQSTLFKHPASIRPLMAASGAPTLPSCSPLAASGRSLLSSSAGPSSAQRKPPPSPSKHQSSPPFHGAVPCAVHCALYCAVQYAVHYAVHCAVPLLVL